VEYLVYGVVALIVIGVIWGKISDAGSRNSTKDELKKRFPGAESFVSKFDHSFLAVDIDAGIICVGKVGIEEELDPKKRESLFKSYPISDLFKVEIVENNSVLMRTNRGSQLAGAALGGAAFGGVGAIIGGLSGSTSSKEKIDKLSMKVFIDDKNRPYHEVTFFKAGGDTPPLNPKSGLAESIFDQANKLHATLLMVMHRAEAQRASNP